jgi:phosphoserine phosphatase
MDSTLIGCECIDELAALAGSGPRVKAITEAAMRGELDFAGSFVQRVATLAGLPASALDDLADRVPVMPGLERLTRSLRALGCKLAIASGGFVPVAESLRRRYGFDEVIANRLEEN